MFQSQPCLPQPWCPFPPQNGQQDLPKPEDHHLDNDYNCHSFFPFKLQLPSLPLHLLAKLCSIKCRQEGNPGSKIDRDLGYILTTGESHNVQGCTLKKKPWKMIILLTSSRHFLTLKGFRCTTDLHITHITYNTGHTLQKRVCSAEWGGSAMPLWPAKQFCIALTPPLRAGETNNPNCCESLSGEEPGKPFRNPQYPRCPSLLTKDWRFEQQREYHTAARL